MSDHEQQKHQPTLRRGKVLEVLARAERTLFTRPPPKSAKACMKFLRTRGRVYRSRGGAPGHLTPDGARDLAGKLTKPQKRLAAALVEETESEWQPQVRAQARAGVHLQGDDGGGDGVLRIHLHGQLGRRTRAPDHHGHPARHVKRLLELQEAGATKEKLHPIVTEAITESYFTEWGTRADGMRADFTAVNSISFRF